MFTINPSLSSRQESNLDQKTDLIIKLQDAVKSGDIRYKLTEPKEIKVLLGNPQQERTRKDGGMDILEISYPKIEIILGKRRHDKSALFTLLRISINGKTVDIGQKKKLELRNKNDLKKLDNFWGFQNISLKNLDLREETELIESMTFDSYTEWPPQDKLPIGFDPYRLLEEGKSPGLGIRNLHEQGINGKGIGIAIIDQPLLLGHEEYTSRLIRYDATGLGGFAPQMHGSPIASIAVGREIGVAPDATLSYFAVPMWEKDNSHYNQALRRIIELNKLLSADEKIRVVSISSGMFSSYKGFEELQKTFKEACEKGVFVVTCDPNFLNYGTLTLIEGKNPDNPDNYRIGRYSSKKDIIRIPTGNKTVASHRGIDVYTYEREGGMSWATPYIAGLAALAFQINPYITPDKIKELLIKTVTKTSAGPIINPIDFIESVKKE
jgi:subtilisin family serine protease